MHLCDMVMIDFEDAIYRVDGEPVMKYSNHNATFVCLCHGCTIVNLAENDIENRSQQENFPFISTLAQK
ncbi:hypothetical protein T03_4411 [Trichinella britovi]|uniref:Uncharacterized protein n=2 Tax=Trichinella TaxID=6333 RepID=A0A0V1CUB9_TRIBR|nr:hypothetical protein T05_14531 [Trichinella murrelli]KRY52900.1 hypothetical protein T03_4411 [Trichinella britovi]